MSTQHDFLDRIVIYDAGVHVPDRYTVVFVDRTHGEFFACLGTAGSSECRIGEHLGRTVGWEDLPESMQRQVAREFAQ